MGTCVDSLMLSLRVLNYCSDDLPVDVNCSGFRRKKGNVDEEHIKVKDLFSEWSVMKSRPAQKKDQAVKIILQSVMLNISETDE